MTRSDAIDPPAAAAPRPRAPLPAPTAAGRMGLRLFLLSLAVFFAAGMVAFVASRLMRPTDGVAAIAVPASLWLSTLLLLLSGIAVERSARYARRARIQETGRWLLVSLSVAMLFAGAQSVGMAELLQAHHLSLTTRVIIGLDGLAFGLILIHALHVLGGMVLLIVLCVRTATGGLSLLHLPTVRSVASYWHFLEFVWLVMLLLFHLFT
ncbi:MAG: cytochrome c oxidase subunit 3 [bacterium]|nr:cytochrome c oxidase subunit 3 [bacterium]